MLDASESMEEEKVNKSEYVKVVEANDKMKCDNEELRSENEAVRSDNEALRNENDTLRIEIERLRGDALSKANEGLTND